MNHNSNEAVKSSRVARISSMNSIAYPTSSVPPQSDSGVASVLIKKNLSCGSLAGLNPSGAQKSSKAKPSRRRRLSTHSMLPRHMVAPPLSSNASPPMTTIYNSTASQLAEFISILACEMTLEEFAKVENEAFTAIFSLVHSADLSERLAGIAGLVGLIGVSSSDEERKGIKFANNLSNGLRSNSDYEFLSAAASALGKMSQGAANADYIEFEVTRALEWLRTDKSDRRLAATLVLRELARSAPTIFFAKTNKSAGGPNEFIDKIFPALWDPKQIVRVCASEALSECLKILAHRQARFNTDKFCKIYAEMQANFTTSSPDVAHGSLLVLFTMLEHTGDFMLPRFEEVCSSVMKLTSHKKNVVRYTVAELIPRLARRCPSAFGRRYLDECLKFLIKNACDTKSRGANEMRPTCFIAIGQLCLALQINNYPPRRLQVSTNANEAPVFSSRAGIYDYLDDIFALVKEGLKSSSKSSSSRIKACSSEALYCAADLVEALGDQAEPYITSLLDEMFNAGLSHQLIYALRSISLCSPKHQSQIEDRLLQELSLCLAGTRHAYAIIEKSAINGQLSYSESTANVPVIPGKNSPNSPRTPTQPPASSPFLKPSLSLDAFHLSAQPNTNAQPLYLKKNGGDRNGGSKASLRSPGRLVRSASSNNATGNPEVTSHAYPASPHRSGFPPSTPPTPTASTMLYPIKYSSTQIMTPTASASSDNMFPTPSLPPLLKRFVRATLASTSEPQISTLVLSLSTLSSFLNTAPTSICSTLLPFIGAVVAAYLEHPSVEVRKEAALTCCRMLLPSETANKLFDKNNTGGRVRKHNLKPSPIPRQSGPSGQVIEQVLIKLLRVAVSDPSPEVRHCMVLALDSRYDCYLCQAHHLSTISLLVQDEIFSIRANALKLFGRLGVMNPAYVQPSLRQVLMRIIFELQCNGETSVRESATRTLIVFLKASALQRLVRPFLRSIVAVLPLKNVATRLAAAALEALGELAVVVRADMKPWLSELIPHIIQTMKDQSSVSKQQTSLRTLGQLVGATGYVVTPYLAYPNLMPIAVAVLPGTKNAPWSLRCEVLRTFGILGAVDPQKLITVSSGDKQNKDKAASRQMLESLRKYSGLTTATNAIDITGKPHGSEEKNKKTRNHAGNMDARSDALDLAVIGHADDRMNGPILTQQNAMEPAHLCMYEQCAMTAQPVSSLNFNRDQVSPSSEDFYPTVVLKALMKILKDPSLAVHHSMVMQAVMFIFQSLGLRCVKFLEHIVPHMLMVVRSSNQQSLRESLLQQLAILASIVGPHMHTFVPDIFAIVTEYWNTHLPATLFLVEKIASGVPDDFRGYVPKLVSYLLSSLEARDSGGILRVGFSTRLSLILASIHHLKPVLGGYLQLLVPALVKLADSFIGVNDVLVSNNMSGEKKPSEAVSPSLSAENVIKTVGFLLHDARDSSLSENLNAAKRNGLEQQQLLQESVASTKKSSYPMPIHLGRNDSKEALSARATQPLFRILGKADLEVGKAIIETLCVICREMGASLWNKFYNGAAMVAISAWASRHQSSSFKKDGMAKERMAICFDVVSLYNETVNVMTRLEKLLANKSCATYSDPTLVAAVTANWGEIDNIFVDLDASQGKSTSNTAASMAPLYGQRHLHVNQQNLQRAWDVTQRTTREDWDEWMRRFAVQLLREAPSPALRACADLAQAYPPLARELFYAAFVSCWFELIDQYQENLVRSLETAFKSDTIPPEILQILLNLAEFMEHDVEALPIDIRVLAELAQKCRAYAKALHYKELEYETSPMSCVEALISINKKLDLPEAALGVLKSIQILSNERADANFDASASTRAAVVAAAAAAVTAISPSSAASRRRQTMSGSNWSSVDYDSFKGVEVKESYLAKLGSWSEALVLYERKLEEDENDIPATLGCMRCLDARGEWEGVLKLANKSWDNLQRRVDIERSMSDAGLTDNFALNSVDGSREEGEAEVSWVDSYGRGDSAERDYKKAVKFCCHAAWRLGKWKMLEGYASSIVDSDLSRKQFNGGGAVESQKPIVDFDGAFYSAVSHIHRKEWKAAAAAINAARMAMDSRFTALMSESYKRAYSSMVTAQMLAEMEEIIELRKLEEKACTYASNHKANLNDPHEHKQKLLAIWKKRLDGCRVDAGVHSSILAVRSLVLGPTDDIDSTLTLAALCRQSQNFKLGEKVLLEPLNALGSDLNGIVFGYEAPPDDTGGGDVPGFDLNFANVSLGGGSSHPSPSSHTRRHSKPMSPIPGVQMMKSPMMVINSGTVVTSPVGQGRMLMSPIAANTTASLNAGSAGGTLEPGGSTTAGSMAKMSPIVSINRIVSGLDSTSEIYDQLHVQHADRIIAAARGVETLNVQHRLYYAYVKHLWATGGKRDEARSRLSLLANTVDLIAACQGVNNNSLRVKCWLTLAEWKLASQSPNSALSPELQLDVIRAYKRATLAGENEYKSWHAWGLFNFRLTKQFKKNDHRDAIYPGLSLRQRHSHTPSKHLRDHIVASVSGFLKAISLGKRRWSASVQQDMLNFLTVLFTHGELPEVNKAINEGMGAVTIEMWLGVLPQLLARIQVKSVNIRSVLHGLLIKLGMKHPQALMYPLSVLLKSPVGDRKEAAESLMKSLRTHSDELVEQSLLVSTELIRVAILWHEMWHEGLEEASRIYFSEGNIQGMLDVLLPLHRQLEAGPSTRRETQFAETFGRDLYEAHQCVQKYLKKMQSAGMKIPTEGSYPRNNNGRTSGINGMQSDAEGFLDQAWDLYYTAFRKINKQLPGLTNLELSSCSPLLLNASNLQLGIPGTYRVDGSYVRISSFFASVQVITSKQRPRKITLRGDDGRDYTYLLKGHEDLRQDERVMQLFGLVNALLAKDRRTNNQDLSIQVSLGFA